MDYFSMEKDEWNFFVVQFSNLNKNLISNNRLLLVICLHALLQH